MDQDTLDKLASGEYSISPRSGRLRKRVRLKKDKGILQRSKFKRLINTFVWILLIAAFVISLLMVIPDINISSSKKKTGSGSTR